MSRKKPTLEPDPLEEEKRAIEKEIGGEMEKGIAQEIEREMG